HNGDMSLWLGGAQEATRDHGAAQESWRRAHGELEPFLKEQPANYQLLGDLALTNMGLGDKAAAFKMIEQAMALIPVERDPFDGPQVIEILARVAAQTGDPYRAVAAVQARLSIPYNSPSGAPLTPA